MPKTVQIDGKDVEVYTQEEVDASRNTAVEDFKKTNPGAAENVTKLQADLTTAQEELKKLKEKDMNFGNLREIKDGLEAKITELTTQLDTKVNAGLAQRDAEAALTALSGGDAELLKKLKLHFETTLAAVKTETPEALQEKLKQAAALSGLIVGNIPAFQSAGGSGFPRPLPQGGNKAGDLKADVADMGKRRFGLSDEDIKKFDTQNFSQTP